MKHASTAGAATHRTAVMAIVLVSYLMTLLDVSIVITALPKIQQSLQFSATELSWVQNAYTLAFGGLLLLGARAGDILGRRRMFLLGMGLFTLASLAIGLAQSPEWLLGARAVQGIGSAILAPSTLALLSTNFAEGPERTRALSLYGATAGVGASIGLVLGGVIADWLSWRVGFFINLPIGLAVIWGARRYIQETERHSAGQFDVLGAVASTLGMGALVYGLVRSASTGWGDGLTVASLAAGLLLLALLVWHESRVQQPIMPLRLFADRERAGAYVARVLFLGAMVGFWFFTTQFLQGVLGFSPFEAGLAYLPTTIPNFAAAMAVPRLSQRFGNGRVLAAGLATTVLGMVWLSCVSVDSLYLTGIALPMVLLGLGQGCTLSPLTVAGIAGVRREDAGAASGLVNAAHQLGGSLGLAILVVVFAAVDQATLDARALLAHRITAAFSAGSVMLVLALAAVLWLIVLPERRRKLAACVS
jgi:EmrB/QacA subfamily drug resistance transporter